LEELAAPLKPLTAQTVLTELKEVQLHLARWLSCWEEIQVLVDQLQPDLEVVDLLTETQAARLLQQADKAYLAYHLEQGLQQQLHLVLELLGQELTLLTDRPLEWLVEDTICLRLPVELEERLEAATEVQVPLYQHFLQTALPLELEAVDLGHLR
jgi:hypothetical protein